MYDNDIIDEYDFEEYTTEVEDSCFDEEDEVDFHLNQLYDLCDNIDVFLAVDTNESVKTTDSFDGSYVNDDEVYDKDFNDGTKFEINVIKQPSANKTFDKFEDAKKYRDDMFNQYGGTTLTIKEPQEDGSIKKINCMRSDSILRPATKDEVEGHKSVNEKLETKNNKNEVNESMDETKKVSTLNLNELMNSEAVTDNTADDLEGLDEVLTDESQKKTVVEAAEEDKISDEVYNELVNIDDDETTDLESEIDKLDDEDKKDDESTDSDETDDSEEDEEIDIDIEALEGYANMEEGEDITVTADLLDVLQKSLKMAKKYLVKEDEEDSEENEEGEETKAVEVTDDIVAAPVDDEEDTEVIGELDESKKLNESIMKDGKLQPEYVKGYVNLAKKDGKSEDDIKKSLKKAGASDKDVEDSLNEDTTTFEVDEVQPKPQSKESGEFETLTKGDVTFEVPTKDHFFKALKADINRLEDEEILDLYYDLTNYDLNNEEAKDILVEDNAVLTDVIYDFCDKYEGYSPEWDSVWSTLEQYSKELLPDILKYIEDEFEFDESLKEGREEDIKTAKDKIKYCAKKNKEAIDDLEKAVNEPEKNEALKEADESEVTDTDKSSKEEVEIQAKKEDEKEPERDGLKIITSINEYTPWDGAVATFEKIQKANKVEELEFMLEDIYPEGITATQLNDLLWFDTEWVLDSLGLKEAEEFEDTDDFDEDLKKDTNYRINRDELKKDIEDGVKDFFKDDEEMLDYTKVVIEDETDEGIAVRVNSEIGFNTMMKLADKLDPIISKYDEDAYFDAEDTGRLVAYIWY